MAYWSPSTRGTSPPEGNNIVLLSPVSLKFVWGGEEALWSIWTPSPGNLPNPEIEPESPALQTDSLLFEC